MVITTTDNQTLMVLYLIRPFINSIVQIFPSPEPYQQLIFFCLFAVHGNWNEWSEFTTCDKTCGEASKTRSRVCNNPPAEHGGLECLMTGTIDTRGKEETETEDCNNPVCISKLRFCFLLATILEKKNLHLSRNLHTIFYYIYEFPTGCRCCIEVSPETNFFFFNY